MIWRRSAGVALLLAALVSATASEAAQEPTIEHLQVSLWPEYDRPDVLVMLDGEIGSEQQLPATLALPIPDEVTPHAVAWRDATGLKVANYKLEHQNGGQLVVMTLPQRSFHLEYYAPLEKAKGRRSYTFDWPGGVGVSRLQYEVEVPSGASDFTIKPATTSERVGSDGLRYRMGALGAVPSGKSARIEISYKKDTDTLSAPAKEPPSATTEPAGMPALTPPAPGASQAAAPSSGSGGLFDNTPLWPAYVAAALLIGILIGVSLQKRGR